MFTLPVAGGRVTTLLLFAAFVLVPAFVVSAQAAEAKEQSSIIGRPVRVVSFCFSPGKPLDQIARHVDAEGAKGADLRDYIARSRRAIDDLRGWSFSTGEPHPAGAR